MNGLTRMSNEFYSSPGYAKNIYSELERLPEVVELLTHIAAKDT